MIIACPACKTRYAVPDSAIGVDGRTVRCAKCKHSWFQDGPPVERLIDSPAPRPATRPAPPPAPVAEPAPRHAPPRREPMAGPASADVDRPARRDPEAPAPEPAPVPAPAPAPVDEPVAPPPVSDPLPDSHDDHAEPPVGHDIAARDYDAADEDGTSQDSSFAHEPPFRPRRNWTRIWTIGATAFALAALGVIGALQYFGMPDWLPGNRPTFVQAPPDLVLEFPPDRQDRRTLPNGIEYFETSGTVTNVGTETRRLPPIKIVLRDSRERIVYETQIVPPVGELAPGESVTVNEAIVDVPTSAKFTEFGWAAF
jgi:predicted Zn finger-like uncharacterized protein